MTQQSCGIGVRYSDSQARRIARKAGLSCIKARGKQHTNHCGGYRLVANITNIVVAGLTFDLSADEVVEIARNEMQKEASRG
jgi:hypothetical protein